MWWAGRYLGIAYMNHPYQFLLLCFTNGLTCSLCVAAYVDYIKNNFPPQIFTVMCGITSSLYNSGGYLIASVLAGVGYNEFGARTLFFVCSASCCCVSILTFGYQLVCTLVARRRQGIDVGVVAVDMDNHGFQSDK